MVRKISRDEIERISDEVKYFIKEFEGVVVDSRELKELILDYFELIIDIIPEYYNKNFESLKPEMNALMDLMSTKRFASSLQSLLEDDEIESFVDYKSRLVETLSILVECNITSMSSETSSLYAWTILRRLWKKEISELQKNLDITEDLALDLVIAIPTLPKEIEVIQLDRYTDNFKTAIMHHSSTPANLDVLGSYTIGRLFDFFFGKGSPTCLKAIGKLLSSPTDDEETISKWSGPIYAEFLKMLYTKLDSYDIKDIKYVLKFIINSNKRYKDIKDDMEAIFDYDVARTYTNISTAINNVLETTSDAKRYL